MVYSSGFSVDSSAPQVLSSPTPVYSTTDLLIFFGVALVLFLVFAAALWRIYAKAGRPGWAGIIPIYNTYVLLKICGMSGWWLLALFVPLLNVFVSIAVALKLAKSFGRSWLFAALWLVFIPIGYLILGFGKSQYLGPGGMMDAGTHEPTPDPPQMPQAAPGVQPMQPPMPPQPSQPAPPPPPVVQPPVPPTPPPAQPQPTPTVAPSVDSMGPPPAPPKPGSVVYPPGQEPPAPPQ